jgi:hypothetical protein
MGPLMSRATAEVALRFPGSAPAAARLAAPSALVLCALMVALGAGQARAATLALPYQSSFSAGWGAKSVAVNHATGNVLVLNELTQSIMQFDAAGTPQAFTDPALAGATELSNANAPSPTWSSLGFSSSPPKIAVDNSGTASQGTIYMANGDSPTVTAFAPSGAVIRTTDAESSACGLGVAPNGSLWIGTLNLGTRATFADEYTAAGVRTGRRLEKPPGITNDPWMCDVQVAGDGAIYARVFPRVAKYSPDLVFQRVVATDADAITVEPVTGNLFALGTYNGSPRVRQHTPDGELVEESGAGVVAHEGGAGALALGLDGRQLYVVNADGQVLIFGPGVRRPEMEAPGGVGTSVADLAGTVWPGGVATTYQFEYGTQKSFGSVAPSAPVDGGSGTAPVPAGTTLTGLKPLTYYFYRLNATVGGTVYAGPTRTFRTLGPIATIGGFSAVRPTSVTLTGTADPRDLADGTYRFRVAAVGSGFEATSEELAVAAGSGARSVSATVSRLPAGRTFKARLVASAGGASHYSEEITFSTPELAAPGVEPVPEFGASPYGCGAPRLDALSGVRRPGDVVSVSGSDLGTGGTVMLGGERVAGASWSSTSVRFAVPRGASGRLAVSVECGRRSNGVALTVVGASNVITLGKATINGSRATVSVKVPGAGRLVTSGRYVAGSTVKVGKAGAAKAKLRLTAAGRRALRRSHRLALIVRVRFVPDGGDGRTESKPITFKRGGVR